MKDNTIFSQRLSLITFEDISRTCGNPVHKLTRPSAPTLPLPLMRKTISTSHQSKVVGSLDQACPFWLRREGVMRILSALAIASVHKQETLVASAASQAHAAGATSAAIAAFAVAKQKLCYTTPYACKITLQPILTQIMVNYIFKTETVQGYSYINQLPNYQRGLIFFKDFKIYTTKPFDSLNIYNIHMHKKNLYKNH